MHGLLFAAVVRVLVLAGVLVSASFPMRAAMADLVAPEYRTTLNNWLEGHKRYPEEARRRGEEGRVLLRFRVDRYGRVLSYSVISSSGFADLDGAAEAMMRGATLPPFPPSMVEPEIEVSVAIRFGLITSIPPAPTMTQASGCLPGYVSIGCPPMRYAPTPQPPTAQPPAPIRSGEDIDDELVDWCEEATKPSSIVICADRDLRQMALIRNKIFADAKSILSNDAFKQLLSDQTKWVQTYSSSCGIAADGPEPPQPISSMTIACFNREAQKRIVALIYRLAQDKPGYRPSALSSIQSSLVDASLQRQQEQNQAERARLEAQAAEAARAQLHAQAIADRKAAITQKLRDDGVKMLSAIDFELDWRDLRDNSQKVGIQGQYMEVDDVEGLMLSNKDMPTVRLYTEAASRDARKTMLECRNSSYSTSYCTLIISGSVITCIRNEGKINEKEIPCIKVENAFVDPNSE